MGKLEDLIKKAKNYDNVAKLEIVDMFQPVVRKYSRMMNHDEDIASELVLALIELVHIKAKLPICYRFLDRCVIQRIIVSTSR